MRRLNKVTLIRGADILTMDERFTVIPGGNVLIRGDEIEYVGLALPRIRPDEEIDATGKLLMPGFSNIHTHLPMSLLRGAGEDLPLMDWLTQNIFPLEDKLDDELAYYGTMLSLAEMIKTGTTSIADMYFFCDGIAKAIVESGMRANMSRCVVGQTLEECDSRVQDALAIYDRHHGTGEGRLEVGFAVQGEYIAGGEVMAHVAKLAQERDAVFQIHVSETRSEHEACRQRHDGLTPFAYLDSIGALNGRVIAAHCVWISHKDMDLIKDRDVTVASCPKSNLKLGSGVARISDMLARGVKVGLGTDGAASNNQLDIMDEMRYLALLQKGVLRDPSRMSINETLAAATRTGAQAVCKGAGSVAPGKKADLILVDTGDTRFLPRQNSDAHLLYSASSRDICMTMVGGRVLYEDGKLTFCNEQKLKEDFCRAAERLYAGKA
ncbi:MAG: amidohydrolase [Christensenellaceae bacterium]|nr:amidohydrolase [Christensenellaceae bacterium]